MNASAGITAVRQQLRNLVPITTTLLFVLFGQLHLPLAFLNTVAPAFALIALYYWVVFRPDLMPYGAVFALGIVHDALSGAPLGLHALVFLLVQVIVLSQRRFIAGKPFWVFWSAFGLIAPIATLFTWLLASLLRGALLPTHTALVALVMTIVLFPVFAWLLIHAQRRLIGPLEA